MCGKRADISPQDAPASTLTTGNVEKGQTRRTSDKLAAIFRPAKVPTLTYKHFASTAQARWTEDHIRRFQNADFFYCYNAAPASCRGTAADGTSGFASTTERKKSSARHVHYSRQSVTPRRKTGARDQLCSRDSGREAKLSEAKLS